MITHIQQFPILEISFYLSQNIEFAQPPYCLECLISNIQINNLFDLIYYLKSETILIGDGLNCLKPPVLLDVPDIALGISEYWSDVPHGGKTQWQIDKHLFPVKRIIGN